MPQKGRGWLITGGLVWLAIDLIEMLRLHICLCDPHVGECTNSCERRHIYGTLLFIFTLNTGCKIVGDLA